MLWGDNFVIPASSPRPAVAELFLNFLLRPEISARITTENYYATANIAAMPLIDPQITADRVIFPAEEVLRHAEIILPLSPAGQALYDATWARFIEPAP